MLRWIPLSCAPVPDAALLARLIDRLPALLLLAGTALPLALAPDPVAALPAAAPALGLLLLYLGAGAAARRRARAARDARGPSA